MAMVNSTTPRLEARCPPVALIFSMRNSRISEARISSSFLSRALMSSGPFIFSNIAIIPYFSLVISISIRYSRNS